LNAIEEKPNYDFRFRVALGGVLGYELNVTKLAQDQIEEIRRQIAFYRQIEHLILFGDVYLLEGLQEGEYGFYLLSKDQTEYYFQYYSLNKDFAGREFVLRTENKECILRVEPMDGKKIGTEKECFYYDNFGKML
jgi:alpha-galactosidase